MNETTSGTGETPTEAPVSAFDFMLRVDAPATPAPGDALAQQSPTLTPHVFDFSDRPERTRPRATALEWLALAFSVIVPPLGLLLAIVARIIARRTHGWITRVLSIATVLGIVLSLVAGAAIVVANIIGQSEANQAKILADSAPFCASLAETPGVLEQPAYGWPTERLSIPDSIVAMQAYQSRWAALADIAPDGVRAGVRSVADAAQTLTNSLVTTQVIDRDRYVEQMTSVTNASGIPAYVARYCR